MQALSELTYVSPGYPVYKSFIVPFRDERGEIVSIRRVNLKDVEDWKEVLTKLRDFIKRAWAKIPNSSKLSFEDKLSILSDLIVSFFRLPLIREPLPQVIPNPAKFYLALRIHCCNLEVAELVEKMLTKNLIDVCAGEVGKVISAPLDLMEALDDRETINLIEKAWYIFPADTRPVFNIAGLLPHMFLTSALAWSFAVRDGLDARDTLLIRISSLLHDIGKPLNPERHYEVGARLARLLLNGVLTDGEVAEVSSFVEEHHIGKGTRKGEIIREADNKASAIDRLSGMADPITSELWRMAEASGVSKPPIYHQTDWEFWRRIYTSKDELIKAGLIEEDPLKELSLKFLDILKKLKHDLYCQKLPTIAGVNLYLFDVGSIQSFIARSSKIQNVIAASFLIDLLTMAVLPLVLQLTIRLQRGLWLPYEAFLYTAGGINLLIAPQELEEDLDEAKKKLSTGCVKQFEVPIRLASAPLTINYSYTSGTLVRKMEFEKERRQLRKKVVEEWVDTPKRRLCPLCYLKPLKNKYCDICEKLYELGEKFRFKERWEKKLPTPEGMKAPKEAFNIEWEDQASRYQASRYVMEIISGHDASELKLLEKGEVERRNIALLKIDGNLMGPYMAEAVSISDVMERSARVDLALKKAYEKSLEALYEGVKDSSGVDEAAKVLMAVKLGTVYMGGDDALILAPSWVALPLALSMGEEFALNMGLERSLSIGVVAASSLHDVWLLIEAANELLKQAKNKGRKEIGMGAICFDVAEAGLLSRHSVEERFSSLKRRGLTSQPLLLFSNDDALSFKDLLFNVSQAQSYKDLFRFSYLTSRWGEGDEQRLLKQIRAAIKESCKESSNLLKKSEGFGRLKLSYVYVRRQAERREQEHVYKVLGWAFLNFFKSSESLLSDIDRAVKMLGGGFV